MFALTNLDKDKLMGVLKVLLDYEDDFMEQAKDIAYVLKMTDLEFFEIAGRPLHDFDEDNKSSVVSFYSDMLYPFRDKWKEGESYGI